MSERKRVYVTCHVSGYIDVPADESLPEIGEPFDGMYEEWLNLGDMEPQEIRDCEIERVRSLKETPHAE